MPKSKENLIETLKKIKKRVLDLEKSSTKLSEQDTRQGLINVLFNDLGWDFSDFESIRSEVRHKSYNEPVDYAFFYHKEKDKPVLLVEAKSLGTNLNNGKVIKQLCAYLGEMGVQWGVLTDGNKYVMYNSHSGSSFEDQKFLTMQIKTADTEDGLSFDDLAEKLIALLSRNCLENDKIQKAYESHVVNRHIEDALNSLLTEPFDTLAFAIKKEFKEDRVKVDPDVKITHRQILSCLELLKDEDGKIPLDSVAGVSTSDDVVLHDIAMSQEQREEGSYPIMVSDISSRNKRIAISDLLEDNLIQEGDSWRFEYKGEITWGRITGNGEIEINGETYSNPSRAGGVVTKKSCNGWSAWSYRNNSGEWNPISLLRDSYSNKHGFSSIKRNRGNYSPPT